MLSTLMSFAKLTAAPIVVGAASLVAAAPNDGTMGHLTAPAENPIAYSIACITAVGVWRIASFFQQVKTAVEDAKADRARLFGELKGIQKEASDQRMDIVLLKSHCSHCEHNTSAAPKITRRPLPLPDDQG